MTTLAVLALVALVATLVLLATVRGQHRAERRMTVGDSGYVYVDGGADSGCSPGSDGGGCGGDGGGGGGD
jgi:hypothetical protein